MPVSIYPGQQSSSGRGKSSRASTSEDVEGEGARALLQSDKLKWRSEGNLGFAQVLDDSYYFQSQLCVNDKAGRRVKFLYVSPVDKHSYRRRFQKNNEGQSSPKLRKNLAAFSSLSNIPSQNSIGPLATQKNNPYFFEAVKGSVNRPLACTSSRSKSTSSLGTLGSLSAIFRMFQEQMMLEKNKPNVFVKVQQFLHRRGYSLSEMAAIKSQGGIPKVSGFQFFRITSFITDFIDTRYFKKVWKVKDRVQQIKMLRDIVLQLARDLGLVNMRLSYIMAPMVKKTVFEDFFSALLDRVEQVENREPRPQE